jgi:hypothetical protein
MKNRQKISILILSTKNAKYSSFKDAIAETWMRDMKSLGIPCYFYEGDGEGVFEGSTISLKVDDSLPHTYEKFIKAVEWVLKINPDTKIIYRTNLSSYIEANNFLKFAEKMQLNEYSYAGFPGVARYWREKFYRFKFLYAFFGLLEIGDRFDFASGSGLFIGRELLTPLLECKKFNQVVDDVEIGYRVKKELEMINTPPRIEIMMDGSHAVPREKYLELINNDYLFHYRFKTGDRVNDANFLRKFHDSEIRFQMCTLTKNTK